jgi:hypothetical protein
MGDQKAVRRAINHLASLGDTDIFPPPFEFLFYREEADTISDVASKLDASQYKPKSCFETLTPKSGLSFRIAHQLYPADTLLYTAAVIEIGPAIEAIRLSVSDGPFSYRFIADDEEPRLFSDSSSFHDWLAHQKELLSDENPFADVRYIIETDISDFYARVYFHRIEHVLDDCDAPNSVRKIIEGIIKFSRARQSHGLPVGTSASRLLAEGLLNDTDRMLISRSDAYTRYVDDFRIVVKHQSEVHATLCKLAEHLMLTEGLSLNASKTRTYSTDSASELIDDKLSDIFNDDELVRLGQYIRAVYDEEDISIEDIEDVDPLELSKKLAEILHRDNVDYTAVRVILKALRAVTYPNPESFVKSFSQLLYYTPRDFCILIGSMTQRLPNSAPAIATILVDLLKQSPYAEMAISRIWVTHLFTAQALPIDHKLLQDLNLTSSVIERRQHLLLRGILRDRAFFRELKTRFDEASDWEKPALMYGASCLAKGEYSTWLDTIKDHVNDPFADTYRKWLLSNRESLFDKLKTQFFVKSKIEILAEAFEDISDDDFEVPL